MQHSEPALLVGDTGTGKTTVCQMLSLMRGQKLHIINCNQHTETSDFLGGFRPVRSVALNLTPHQDFVGILQGSCGDPVGITILHHTAYVGMASHDLAFSPKQASPYASLTAPTLQFYRT